MKRRELLRAGVAGAVGTWFTSSGSGPDLRADASVGAAQDVTSFRLTLYIAGSNLVVFNTDAAGKLVSADVRCIFPDREKDCERPMHWPILALDSGTATSGEKVWPVGGLWLTPRLPGPFTATDWNVEAGEGEHPTQQTGWLSLRWLPMLRTKSGLGALSEKRLADRTAARLTLTGGLLQAALPETQESRSIMWKLKTSGNQARKPAVQAITDRMRLTAQMTGSELVIARKNFSGELDPIRIRPAGTGPDAEIVLTMDSPSSNTSEPYDYKKPVTHVCGLYQVLDSPPKVKDRFIYYPDARFASVDETDPVTVEHYKRATRYKSHPSGHGQSNPPPLCDAARIVRTGGGGGGEL